MKFPWKLLFSLGCFWLAFPPFSFWFALLPGFALWFASFRTLDERRAWQWGYLFGFLFALTQFTWLYHLASRWTDSFWLGVIPWVLGCLLEGLFYAFLARAFVRCRSHNKLWLFPLQWAGMEVLRSSLPGIAFPWMLVASPLAGSPALIQPAYFGTIFLVSAMVVWIAATLTREISPKLGAAVCVIYAGATGYLYNVPESGDVTRLMVAQPGVDVAFGNPDEVSVGLAQAMDFVSERAETERPDLVVLPEGLVHGFEIENPTLPFRLPSGVNVIFGATRRAGGKTYQSAVLRGSDASWHFADKSRLVVFGEYVPGREWLPFLKAFRLPSGDLTPADHASTLQTNKFAIGPLICFESLFFDVADEQTRNGAQLLTTLCIDDWYFDSDAPQQLRSSSVFRAVESGLPLARSAMSGYSIVVDTKGRVLGELPLHKTDVLSVSTRLPAPRRPWFPKQTFPVIALLSWAYQMIFLRRKPA